MFHADEARSARAWTNSFRQIENRLFISVEDATQRHISLYNIFSGWQVNKPHLSVQESKQYNSHTKDTHRAL
ncbi:hypothetical protein KL86DPRO_11608 [uncultured delta proteobacterium]|uniref:Uncharacterized protein n=1 Tax=uncultured delta proteobacterium TaxID=34034 RepID=A0A212JJC0_9DELT|nr:hypothetical protein KL86DPRO_11608 [uncultured delta proteobacterium]